MTAADLAPWTTPAITIALIAWLRMDGFDARLRALEVTVAAMAAKLDLLERYFLRRNDEAGEPPLAPAE